MPTETPAAVLSLRLDPANARVWRGEQLCKLTPKAFAVLHYLVEHHGHLVTKEDLLRAAWPNTVVSEWALTTCLREIRKVLGDQPRAPQWIETVYRRGYRFIAPVVTTDPSTTVHTTSSLPLPISYALPRVPLVGREAELTQLHQWFDQAQGGARQEQGYGARAAEIATELAVHFERGRDPERAVKYLRLAAENASRRSAHREVIAHLTQGVALLTTLPASPDRLQQELSMQIPLARALLASKGWAAPEVERTYARARELCQQVGETPRLLTVLWGLQVFYATRAEYQMAREIAEQMFTLAQRQQDSAAGLLVHATLGGTLVLLGELAAARTHLEQGLTLCDVPQHHTRPAVRDSIVYCLAWAANALWSLGYPEQALQRSQQALTLAQELARPLTLTFALAAAAMLHSYRREGQAVYERAEALIALATEHGLSLMQARGTLHRGWALAAQGQGEPGMAQMCQGLVTQRALGAQVHLSGDLAKLAEAYGQAGQVDEGLRLITEALAMVAKTGERYYAAELYRLKGELLLALAGKGQKLEEAETSLRHALEVARCQQAKLLELRGAMSLSRLWQQQGKREEARQLLAEIYGWFTEGFDTADLQEAKALLLELGL